MTTEPLLGIAGRPYYVRLNSGPRVMAMDLANVETWAQIVSRHELKPFFANYGAAPWHVMFYTRTVDGTSVVWNVWPHKLKATHDWHPVALVGKKAIEQELARVRKHNIYQLDDAMQGREVPPRP